MAQINQPPLNLKVSEKTQFWHNHIHAHEKSGLAVEEYCEKKSLSSAKFRYQRNKYIGAKNKKNANQFVALKITDPQPSKNKPLCTLKFVKGHELQIYDYNTLALLLERLN